MNFGYSRTCLLILQTRKELRFKERACCEFLHKTKMRAISMEQDSFEENDKAARKVIERYKTMLKEAKVEYFDVHEFDVIIRHYRAENRLDAALYAIDFAVQQHSDELEFKKHKGEILLEQGKLDDFFLFINYILEENPAHPPFLLLLGSAYLHQEEIEKAKATFDAAIEQQQLSEQIISVFAVAISFEHHKHYKYALAYFEKAQGMGLQHEMLDFFLGSCFNRLDMLKEGMEAYKRFLAKNPFSVDGWFNYGIVALKSNAFSIAIEAFEYALALDPAYDLAWLNLGNAFSYSDQQKKAIEAYLKFLDANPDDVEVLMNVGYCYKTDGDWSTGKTYMLKAVNIKDDHAPSYYTLALNCFLMKEFEDCLNYIQQAVSLDSQNTLYLYVYGSVQLELDNVKESIKIYEEAVAIDPHFEDLWISFSEIFAQQKDYSAAVQLLEKGYQYNYDKAATNFRLAAYYLKMDDDKGIQHLEEGLQINPAVLEEFTFWMDEYKENEEVMRLLQLYNVDEQADEEND